MKIGNGTPKQLPQIIHLFKNFFPRHNIFCKDNHSIAEYLTNLAQTHILITATNEDPDTMQVEVLAATFIVKRDQSQEGKHMRWTFKHFAFSNQEAAKELLKHCEEYVNNQSLTTKIELSIAESESCLHFFKEQRYTQQAELTNHYRWGETCFILGKSVIPRNTEEN